MTTVSNAPAKSMTTSLFVKACGDFQATVHWWEGTSEFWFWIGHNVHDGYAHQSTVNTLYKRNAPPCAQDIH